jgi:hypothetical protein
MKHRAVSVDYDPHLFASETGYVFTGITVAMNHDGWKITIKAFKPTTHEAVYATTVNDDVSTGVDALLDVLCSRGGVKFWRQDRYAK